MKARWLGRHISAPGPFLCLCLSEAEYKTAFKHLRVVPTLDWIKTPHSNATSHLIQSPKGLAVVVCLAKHEKRNAVEVAGILVHEAVHAWQEWCDYYGETHPASEQEAYAIQALSQYLMFEFTRRMKSKRRIR